MRNYFNIPNQMAFLNVNQDNGRVIKGSAIMGFSTNPKNCLEDAAGDLRTMGCALFYKKCQEVDTVAKIILLGVPNSIEEDVIKITLDTVLSELECTLLKTDSEYKMTKDQRQNWINCTVTREYPPGMPWEDAEEKKSRGATTRCWYTYCRCTNPTTTELASSATSQNNASCGPPIGKIRLLQSKYRRMIANKEKKSTISRWYRLMGRYVGPQIGTNSIGKRGVPIWEFFCLPAHFHTEITIWKW
jgi:hypothetical protein